MEAVVAAFNQEKALVGAFSVITNLRMELFEALSSGQQLPHRLGLALLGGEVQGRVVKLVIVVEQEQRVGVVTDNRLKILATLTRITIITDC